MAITWESASAQVKTGKSCAIRCLACGEATIGDEFVHQVMNNVRYQGVQVSSSLNEKDTELCCRLCGTINPILPEYDLITWEEFEFALATDDFIGLTNPAVPHMEVSDLMDLPRGVPRTTMALLEYLRANQSISDALQLPTIVLGISFVGGIAIGVAADYATGSNVLGWVAGLFAGGIGALGAWIISEYQSVEYLTDKHGTFVCRFLNEMDVDLNELIDQARKAGGRYKKAGKVLAKIPEYYEV